MRKFVFALSALLLVASQAMASQKIVCFDSAYRNSVEKGIEGLGGRITKKFKVIDAVVAVFPDEVKSFEILDVPGVTNVDDDKYLPWLNQARLPLMPTVESALGAIRAGETGLEIPAPAAREENPEIPWGVKRVNAAGAWEYFAGQGVKVAVIDTGIDFTHPDLAPNYKGGYNAVTGAGEPRDDQGHGTHVSGTVGAALDGQGVVGVAPKAELYAVKVLDKNGSGQYSWIVSGIEWAILNGMHVANMSLGGRSGTEALRLVMIKAREAGLTVVCAAGNDSGPVNYPAKYPEAIAVSASDSADKLASFSSKGPEIHVIAPGVNVYSTRMGGGYRNMSGTSMASPHVAGLAALAVSAGYDTPDKVRHALKLAAAKLPNLQPNDQGNGMVDAGLLKENALWYYIIKK